MAARGAARAGQRREQEARPVPRSRPARLKEAKRRLDEQLFTECRANAAYEAYRARGVMRNGRRLGPNTTPKPYQPPEIPEGRINLTDPDSRVVKGLRGFIQGYNAQAVTTEDQVVIAAEVMVASPDFGHLEPMLDAARPRARGGRRHRHPEVGARRRRLLAPRADGTIAGAGRAADPTRLQPPQGARQAGKAASTPSCASGSRPTAALSSTGNASR